MSKVTFIDKEETSFFAKISSFLCLLFPIGIAFAGYFASEFVWKHFTSEPITEFFKFAFSGILFVIASFILFLKTRNANPLIQIRVSEQEINSSEDSTSQN